MQGTANAILLRPRPHPNPRQQPSEPNRGKTPEAPRSSAGRSDAWKYPKRAVGRGPSVTFLDWLRMHVKIDLRIFSSKEKRRKTLSTALMLHMSRDRVQGGQRARSEGVIKLLVILAHVEGKRCGERISRVCGQLAEELNCAVFDGKIRLHASSESGIDLLRKDRVRRGKRGGFWAPRRDLVKVQRVGVSGHSRGLHKGLEKGGGERSVATKTSLGLRKRTR